MASSSALNIVDRCVLNYALGCPNWDNGGASPSSQVPASGADIVGGFFRGGLAEAEAAGATGFSVIMTGFGLWS